MTTAQTIALLLGVLVSPVTGLLTKAHASPALKAFVNFALSSLAGVVVTVTFVNGTRWQDYVRDIGYAWVVSIATHYGFWKPTGVTAAVQSSTANVGLGSSSVATDDTMPDGYSTTPKTTRKSTARRAARRKT